MLTPSRTLFLVCDIQTRFSSAIHAWPHVVETASKMIRFAQILGVPVLTTEQNPKALGPTDPGVNLASLPKHLNLGTFPKTKFSMLLPETVPLLDKHSIDAVAIFGIESHICVLQTVLELRETRPETAVYVIADGVSSCNKEEIPIALDRLRAAGAQITTSESFLFQLQHDAGAPTFKAFSKAVKDVMPTTRDALRALAGDGGSVVESKL